MKRQMEKLDKRRRREKPENVTWAKKEDFEIKMSDSFELPLQGARKSEGNGGGDGGGGDNSENVDPNAFGTFRYHRGWV